MVVLRPERQYLFVVEDGVAHRRDVELGYGQGDMIDVIRQLEVGATIVIHGGERLRDGQAVTWPQGSEL